MNSNTKKPLLAGLLGLFLGPFSFFYFGFIFGITTLIATYLGDFILTGLLLLFSIHINKTFLLILIFLFLSYKAFSIASLEFIGGQSNKLKFALSWVNATDILFGFCMFFPLALFYSVVRINWIDGYYFLSISYLFVGGPIVTTICFKIFSIIKGLADIYPILIIERETSRLEDEDR